MEPRSQLLKGRSGTVPECEANPETLSTIEGEAGWKGLGSATQRRNILVIAVGAEVLWGVVTTRRLELQEKPPTIFVMEGFMTHINSSYREKSVCGYWFILGILIGLLAMVSPVRSESQADKGEWTPLFNGKNLDGWVPKIRGYPLGENFGNTFHVEEGILKVSYEAYDEFDNRFGHLFYEGEFSHYRLRVEYRFVGDQAPGGPGWAFRNSGIMIHGQPPETMGLDQKFPVSIEVQLLGGRGEGLGERTTANLCTPGTNVVLNGELFRPHCVNSTSKTYNGDQWVTVEVEVHGNGVIQHIIDGEVVLEYEKPQLDDRDEDARKLIKDGSLMLENGTISLQSESHPVEFRKVEIQLLDE